MDGNFEFTPWATVAPAAGWQLAVGRFTGGDRDELVGYHPSNGTVWVGANDGHPAGRSTPSTGPAR